MLRSMILAALLSLAACKEPRREPRPAPRPWPTFPTTLERARALIKAQTRRPVAAPVAVPTTADAMLELLRSRQPDGTVVAGWEAIVGALDQRLHGDGGVYLLWGTYHDAGGQLEAFRRLIGPAGLRSLTAASLEQLMADGRWRGVAAGEQQGITRQVERYLSRGDRGALEAVRADQRRANYTGWKYRYLSAVTDLLITARAARLRLVPCDMPGPLQRRSQGDVVDRLRELHCLFALKDALRSVPPPHRVAMAWGQGHLRADALQRFLPPKTRVITVHVFGHRPGSAGLEHELRGRLRLTDPLLVSLDQSRYLLFLDGPVLSTRLERALDRLEGPLPEEQRHQLTVTAAVGGVLLVGRRRVELEAEKPTVVSLSPGRQSYLFAAGDRGVIAGSVTLPEGGALELTLGLEEKQVGLRLLVRGRQPP